MIRIFESIGAAGRVIHIAGSLKERHLNELLRVARDGFRVRVEAQGPPDPRRDVAQVAQRRRAVTDRDVCGSPCAKRPCIGPK